VDARAVDLLNRFVEKLRKETVVAKRRGAGASVHWETTEVNEYSVTHVAPETGVIEFDHGSGRHVRLHLTEARLLEALQGAGDTGTEAWGEPLSDGEAAARFLTVHLEESLATRDAYESDWWEYEGGRFAPLPPWEAHARSPRQG
jgi:hypothetical protein